MLGLAVLVACVSCKPSFMNKGLAAHYLSRGNTSGGQVVAASPAVDRLGNAGYAYNFNGSNSCITFKSVPLTQIDNWTLAVWIKPAVTVQHAMVVCLGFDDGNKGDGIELGLSDWPYYPGDHLYGLLGGVKWVDSGYAFPMADMWYHVVMLRRDGVLRFYVNGVQTPNTETLNPLKPTAFTIGSGTGARFFNGVINDVRIYKRALSDAEVQQLYNYEKAR